MLFTLIFLPMLSETFRSRREGESPFTKIGRIIFAPLWSFTEIPRCYGAIQRFENFKKIDKDYGFENLNKNEMDIIKRSVVFKLLYHTNSSSDTK